MQSLTNSSAYIVLTMAIAGYNSNILIFHKSHNSQTTSYTFSVCRLTGLELFPVSLNNKMMSTKEKSNICGQTVLLYRIQQAISIQNLPFIFWEPQKYIQVENKSYKHSIHLSRVLKCNSIPLPVILHNASYTTACFEYFSIQNSQLPNLFAYFLLIQHISAFSFFKSDWLMEINIFLSILNF